MAALVDKTRNSIEDTSQSSRAVLTQTAVREDELWNINYDSMQATATHMAETDAQTTFVPEGDFTQEVFDTVRQSILIVQLETVHETLSNVSATSQGTAWLAATDDEYHYFATNKHVVETSQTPDYINFRRSELDPEVTTFPFSECKIVVSESVRDAAIIACPVQPHLSIQPLQFHDNFVPSPGTPLLLVGYPGMFRQNLGESLLSRSQGFVTAAEYSNDILPEEPSQMELPNLVFAGSSGSPVIMNNNGELVVVGMAYAGGVADIDGEFQPSTSITRLDMQSLIEEVR